MRLLDNWEPVRTKVRFISPKEFQSVAVDCNLPYQFHEIVSGIEAVNDLNKL